VSFGAVSAASKYGFRVADMKAWEESEGNCGFSEDFHEPCPGIGM